MPRLTAEGALPASKRRGQWSWALYEAARDPNQVFQIFVISPFIATVMIRDPIAGQQFWGSLSAYSGIITAILCPFFGAIADRGGPRKPWLALFTLLMVLSFAGTWFGVADSTPMQIFIVGCAIVINNIVFEFSNAFHGAMLSRIAPPSRIGGLSGLSFALGTGSGFILMLVFLVLFILPSAPIQLAGSHSRTSVGTDHGGVDAGVRDPAVPVHAGPRAQRVAVGAKPSAKASPRSFPPCAASNTIAMSRTTSARARCSMTG